MLRLPSSDPGIADPFACLQNRESEVLQLEGFGFGTLQISEKIK